MKKLLSILSLFISILSGSAQETEWINGLGGNKSSIPYITCDSNGDIIMATSSSVAFTYRGFSVLNNAGQDNLILMKYNPKDSLLWLISTNVPASSTIKPLRVNTDNNNNIYILVQYFGGPIPLSPSISLVSSGANYRHAILKYSPNGTLIWKREFGRTDMDVYWTRGIKIFSDRLYFTSYYDTDNCNVSFEDAVDTFTVSKGAILSCYDTSGAFLYANTFDGLNVINYSDIGVLNHNSIYFNGSVENKSIIGKDTVFSGIYIFNIDSNGLLLSKNYVVNNTNITYNRFTLLDLGASLANIAWAFNAMDSLLFNDSVILTDNYNYPTSIVFNQNNKFKWHAHTTATSPSVFSPGGGVEDGGDGTFYIGGNLQGGTVNIKGIPLVYRSTAIDLCILKFDTKGNVLWGFTDGGFGVSIQVSSIASDKKGNFYVAGIFFNKIRLFNDSLLNKGIAESFIAKITDYSITRGEVSAGPYCAGDSMDIPYTKMGRYNPDNWFIAQLSDENGNFDDTSKVRELGRLQATEDSTIRGALPLFQVSSSANYRIRVISTSPPVQSFYKRDSLRLLIYSMDKADPGPPETVCLGDSFHLHTYGGTVWEWSPKYLMDDSTSRTPTILAMKDTIFKIVISDTSGCGEPDTAFKQIFIKSNPKIVANADTFYACLNEDFALHASFQDGDSAGYNWTWYNIPRANVWREIKSDSFSFVDTVYYTHNTSTRNISLVLNDGCSIKEDTAFYTIVLHPSRAKGKITTLENLQCYGSLVDLFGNISGGDSATYSWEWFEIDEQNIPVFLDSGKGKFADTIGVQLDKSIFDSRKFAFVTKDECLPYVDSSFIELKIDRRVPKAIVFPRDTAVCPSTSAEITAQISDGSGKGFRWKWIDEKGNILSQDSGNVSETKTIIKPIFNNQDSQRFWFIVEDICSPECDTQKFVISPLHPLEINELYSGSTLLTGTNGMLSGVEACFGAHLNFTANGKGGTEQNYQWNWKIFNPDNNVMLNLFQHLPEGNSDSLTDYEPSELLRKLLVTLTLQDGCMEKGDSISFEVIIREPLKAHILNFAQKNANDTSVCSGSELKFFAKGTGGVEEDYEFTWLLDDEEISKGDSVEINSKDFKNPDAILTLILSDDCSILPDTQKINIHTLPELKAEFSTPDTICLGEEISLTAQGVGGIKNQYQFTWLHKKDDGTLEVLKNADTLDLNSKSLISESQYSQFNTREIFLVLRDNCSSPNDTFSRKIIIRPELSLTLSSSTICADPSAILTANPQGGNQNSYSINWFDKNGDPLGNGLTQTASPEGFDKFSATLSDNCSSESATAEIKIDRVPDLLTLENTPNEGCQPLPVIFEPKTNYPDKYGFKINFGNNNSENASEGTSQIDYTYKTAGNFTPSLKITTQNGCEKTIQGTPITIYPKPIADFSFEPEDPDMDNPFVQFINQSYGAKSYIWTLGSFGDFTEENPEIEYQDTGYHNVRLIAISDKNCSDTTESQIYIKTNYRVFLPSAFSPNGDGLNDDFKPSVRGFSELDFRVYSRWGELVFHSTKDEAWDGTFNGEQMPDGVYAFTLSVINVFGEKQFFKGTVTLIR